MSYNAFSRPRFYTNSVEHLYNKGNITSIDPVFLSSSWHSPKTYTLEPSTTTSGYGYIKGFKVNLNKSSLLYDFNYIMILGHNLHSTGSSFRCYFSLGGQFADPSSLWNYTYGSSINMTSNTSFNIDHTSDNHTNAWNIPDYDYVPVIVEVGSQSILADEIKVRLFNPTETPIKISGISLGSFYDLPYNPDLGIKKSISYDNVDTHDTISGKTVSSDFGSSKPFNPFVNVYNDAEEQEPYDVDSNAIFVLDNVQDFTPSGRRSYDISYSYIGSSESGQNHLMPRDFNFYKDIEHLDLDHEHDATKGNLYTSVINKTMGSHIPFIFSLNGSDPNDLMLARFKDNNFSFDEVAPSVHNVSFGIREVW